MSNTTTVEKVEVISEAIVNIKDAIADKGVTVPAVCPIDEIAGLIDDIPSGGGDETLKALIERPIVSTTISIPDGTPAIGNYAFYNFENLSAVTIPSSVTAIGEYAFYSAGMTSITVPDTVSRVGDSAFRNCTQLVTANVDASDIGALAFDLCQNLTTLILGDSVTQLGDRMAYRCYNLTTVTIPASIRTLQRTFGDCPILEYVTIKNGFNANNLNLSISTLYSHDTILSWLNALADRTGRSAYTLTIGSTNLAKLTAEEIAIAANKNWNLA